MIAGCVGLFAAAASYKLAANKIAFSPNNLFANISPDMYDINVGEIYLQTQKVAPSREDIYQKLSAKVPVYMQLYSPDRVLRKLIVDDLKSGKSVMIQGWILPETAALISALAALRKRNVH